jgi:HAD superfamily hydrolase (TIGR01549 family)
MDKPFDGIHEVLKTIASRGGNFLVTHRDRTSTESILTRFALIDYFKCIITDENGFPLKPSPESFNFVIDRYSLDRSATLGIGDREIDVDAAKNAGIRSCYFRNDGSRIDHAEFNISSFRELPEIINCS